MNFDLTDLVNERHIFLKNVIEEKWSEVSDIPITYSEWYIMTRIYKKQPTIANVAKNVHISRQATHKVIKKLEEKGIVEITEAHNKREKGIQLTYLGEQCYEKNVEVKAQLERTIANHIGEEKLNILKEILSLDWGL